MDTKCVFATGVSTNTGLGGGADPYVSVAGSYFSLPILLSLSLFPYPPYPTLLFFPFFLPHTLPPFYFQELPAFLEFTINFFFLFIWLHWVLSACRIFSSSMGTLNCSMWNLVPRLPTFEVWSLSHWTTREVPVLCCVESLLCNPTDCSLPGSSVHGILQARILESVAMPSSRGSSRPRDQTQVSCTAGGFFTV